MSLASFALAISVIEFLLGIPLLLCPKAAGEWILRFKDEETSLRFMGTFLLIISVLVLVPNPSVGLDVAGLVRLAAWVTALKSLSICWGTKRYAAKLERFFSKPFLRRPIGLMQIVIGVLLAVAGVILGTPAP